MRNFSWHAVGHFNSIGAAALQHDAIYTTRIEGGTLHEWGFPMSGMAIDANAM